MAHGLPISIAIRYEQGYASYTTGHMALQGYVGFKDVDVFNPVTKVEVETAKINRKYVHLRFCYNNRYLARVGAGIDDVWLVATSDQKVEDESKWSCTLFQPIVNDDAVAVAAASSSSSFQMIHVQSGKHVRVNLRSSYKDYAPNCLYVGDQPPNCANPLHTFGYVDRDSIVMLPKHLAFKGENDLYLESCLQGRDKAMLFKAHGVTAEGAAYEVTMKPNGYLRIKCGYFGNYWRVVEHEEHDWVRPEAEADAGEDDRTLFWPVKLDDKTVALRPAGIKTFCKRMTSGTYESGLAAASHTIDTFSKLQVQELVLQRQIYDIAYHVDRARIYDERPVVVGEGSAANYTQQSATLTIRVPYEDIYTYYFRNDSVLKLGVESTIKAGIPFISDGQIEVSAELSTSLFEWNTEITKRIKKKTTHEVLMAPMSSVRVKYVATQGKCDVPFSYAQRDLLLRDGSFVTTTHIDGVFTGVNYYSFRIEPVIPSEEHGRNYGLG